MLGTALAVGSALASAYGSHKSAQANREQDRFLDRRNSEIESWYDKEYNTDYLDSAEAQSSLRILSNNIAERMKKADQGNAIKGTSDEGRVASAEQGQKTYADALTRLAGFGTRYKDNIRREYMMRQMGLDNATSNNLAMKSAQWSNFMNNSMNAGIGFAEADGMDAFGDLDNNYVNWRKKRILNKAGGAVSPVSTGHLQIPKLS